MDQIVQGSVGFVVTKIFNFTDKFLILFVSFVLSAAIHSLTIDFIIDR